MENICSSFLQQVVAQPDAVAVRAGRRSATYSELSALAHTVAQGLREAGIRPGDRIAVALSAGIEFAAVIVAAASLGVTYVPLDLLHTSRRLDAIIAQSRCAAVVSGQETNGWGAAQGLRLIDAMALMEQAASGAGLAAADLAEVGSDRPLYLVYTSGSTGQPKGVLIPHDGVVQLIEAASTRLRLEAGLVWAVAHSLAFDVSVWELWGALLTGGTASFATREQVLDPAALAEFVVAEDINVFSQTPSSFRRIADHPDMHAAAASGRLRYLIFAGEPLPADLVRKWTDHCGFSRPELVNMYGITETTVHTTWRILDPESISGADCPIGEALPGRKVLVCDPTGVPVPPGTLGELFVGGAGLAVGYLDDPDLTAERFVTLSTPHGPERFYRSGDLGLLDERGDLHHRGRADRQVKIRGHRVALEEVEAVARLLGGVADAVVKAMPRPGEVDQSLVAYLVPATSGPLDLAACASQLRENLPSFLVPARLVNIPGVPLTANGKIDKGQLPDPWELVNRQPHHQMVFSTDAGPENVESAIVEAFAEILFLDHSEIGPDSDFFALGGDSLLATRFMVEVPWLRERLSLTDFYQHSSARTLAAAWEKAEEREARVGEPSSAADTFSLTRAQEGLFYGWLTSDRRLYQDAVLVRVRVPCELTDLARCVQDLGEAHPAARLRFDLEAVGAEVRVAQTADVRVTTANDGHLSIETAMAGARDWIARSRDTPFDLESESPFRVRIAQLRDDSFTIAIVAHHAACDGWSFNVFIRDIVETARAKLDLAAVRSEASDFLAVLRALPRLEQRDVATLRASGTAARLRAAVEGLDLGPEPMSQSRGIVSVEVDAETASAAEAFARKSGVPLKSVYIAAHLRAAGLPHEDKLISCVPVSARPDLPGADRCIGYFVRPRLIVVDDVRRAGATDFVRAVWAAERELMRTRFAPLADQLGTLGNLPLPVLGNFVDFHVLDNVADAILCAEAVDDNSFPLTIDMMIRRARSEGPRTPLMTALGRYSPAQLEEVALQHVATLRNLVG